MITLLISFILSMYSGPNVYSDCAFQKAINDKIIPYETQIPWSTEHYLALAPEPVEEVVEEPVEEVVEEEVVVEEVTEQPTTEAVQVTAGDIGILSIPAAGINVGLYSDGNAFQASGCASVQYYNEYGIKWIADHVNQDGFWNLKYLNIGDTVYINDVCYTVVDNVYAADYYSNFNAWVGYVGDSVLILQTCEGDGARLVRCQ